MVVLTKTQETEVRRLLAQNRRLEAVKKVWGWSRAGMKAAKKYVDRITSERHLSHNH
ncbi:MAG: hypothetical protein ACPGJS_03955 [Flammeovirgaceae bacterium]